MVMLNRAVMNRDYGLPSPDPKIPGSNIIPGSKTNFLPVIPAMLLVQTPDWFNDGGKFSESFVQPVLFLSQALLL
jgi:hypothetical protein